MMVKQVFPKGFLWGGQLLPINVKELTIRCLMLRWSKFMS